MGRDAIRHSMTARVREPARRHCAIVRSRTKVTQSPPRMRPTFHPAVNHARLCILCSSFRHHDGNRAFVGKAAPTTSSISCNVIETSLTPAGCSARKTASRMYFSDRRSCGIGCSTFQA